MFIVQLEGGGAGDLLEATGYMALEVFHQEDVNTSCTDCGGKLLEGEVVGWFDDGYSARIPFCHYDIVDPTASVHFFATEEEAKLCVDLHTAH